MVTVDTATKTRFWDSFRASSDDIQEGLAVGRATAADGHWTKWAYFCARVSLYPLLVFYKDPSSIHNAFARDYRTGDISPNSRAVRSRTVEDAVQSIGRAITVLVAKDPRMTSTGKINGKLQLQFHCYSRQNLPPSWVKPIPVQVLRRLDCMAAASNDQELQAITDMIIISFFLLLRPGEYTNTNMTAHHSACQM